VRILPGSRKFIAVFLEKFICPEYGEEIVMDNKMLQKSNTERLGRSDCCGLFVMHKALNVVCISSLHLYVQIIWVQRTRSSGVLKSILNKINKIVNDSDMFRMPSNERLRRNGYLCTVCDAKA
jgi:hypothetical protein